MDTLQLPEPGFDYGSLEPSGRAVAHEAAAEIKCHGQRAAAGKRVTHASVKADAARLTREPPARALPVPAPVAAEPAPEDLDEPPLPLPEPAPAEGPAPDLASEFAALHRRLTALGHGAKEVARAVPPAARQRHLDEARPVLAWLEDYCWTLQREQPKAA